MSSIEYLSSQRNDHRNINANTGTTLKRRSNNRGYRDFQEKRSRYLPPQKRFRSQAQAQTQTQTQTQTQPQFRSVRNLPPLYYGRSNVSRNSQSYNYGDVIDSNSRKSFPFGLHNNDFTSSNIDYQKPFSYGNPNPQIVPLPLPYRKLDVSCDSLPEWVPNESTSRTLTPNFPISSNYAVFTNFPKSLPLDHSNMVSIVSQSLPLNNSNMVSASQSMSQPIFEAKDLSYLLSILNKEKEKQNSEASKSDELPSGLSFDNPMSLRVRHESVIKSLYSDMPRQCTSCGLRFKSQEDHSNHMDWHVRKNRMAKNTTRQSQRSREWFASKTLWLSAATTGGSLETAKASFGESQKKKEEEAEQEHVVPADENQKICALCEEPFEDFFSHEADDWMYKDAVYLSKNGPIVHAKCRPETR